MKSRIITTYDWLDLETLGSWPIMHKILPGHWIDSFTKVPAVKALKWYPLNKMGSGHSRQTTTQHF